MHNTSRFLAPLVGLTVLFASSVAMAQPSNNAGEGQSGGRQGPPAEAIAACKTAKASDSCSFSSPQGNVSGTCQAPEGRPLACAPAGGKGPGGASSSAAAPRQ